MIVRIWHGWTDPDNADRYEELLKEEIFVGIANRRIDGYRGITLLRRDEGAEVAFITLMRFESLAAVRLFAGEEYEKAVVPPKARLLLARFDDHARHYDVRAEQGLDPWTLSEGRRND